MAFLEGLSLYLTNNFVMLIALIGVIYLFTLPHRMLRSERILLIIAVSVCAALSVAWFILNQYGTTFSDFLKDILAFFIYIGTPFITFCFFYAISGLKKRRWVSLIVVFAVGIASILCLIFTDYGYKEVDGKLILGELAWLSCGGALLFVIISLIYGIKKRSKDKILLSVLMTIATAATILFVNFTEEMGVSYIVAIVCCSFCYSYKYYVYDTVYQAQQIKRKQISLAVSQIQPHFIFNALNSIYALTDTDIIKAKEVLNNFSTYLRVNIDSLSSDEPIEFTKELEHIETYVMIEKIRFGNRLNMKYDIQFNNFKIAPLTLQPLIENAIRHGICKKKEGGVVTLSTRRIDDNVEIRIEDTGVGFDVEEAIDTSAHVGFTNVKERVEGLYKGKFEYSSTIGVGTKIKILLPLK